MLLGNSNPSWKIVHFG